MNTPSSRSQEVRGPGTHTAGGCCGRYKLVALGLRARPPHAITGRFESVTSSPRNCSTPTSVGSSGRSTVGVRMRVHFRDLPFFRAYWYQIARFRRLTTRANELDDKSLKTPLTRALLSLKDRAGSVSSRLSKGRKFSCTGKVCCLAPLVAFYSRYRAFVFTLSTLNMT